MIWPFKKPGDRDRRAGIVLDPALGGAVAVVERHGERVRLQHWARCQVPADGNWPLDQLVAGADGQTIAVIEPEHYQLMLVDRPDVPDGEVAAAVRWRIRDLINFPVEEAVVDIFDVPAQARGNRRMIYAVAARQSRIDSIAKTVNAATPLFAIDIAELCLRNVAGILPQDRFGVACLLIHGSSGFLTLSREQQLYLIRQMEVPDSITSGPESATQLALEIQRSLDYFESHYDQRPIRDLVVAPSAEAAQVVRVLGQEMAVNVSLLDLNELVEAPRELESDEQADCFLAFGAALRGPDQVEQVA